MAMTTQKITVTLPKTLITTLDQVVSSRQRSKFIEDAIRQQLALQAQIEAVEESAGSWGDESYPELANDVAIDAWLGQVRSGWQRTG